jgi:hypothetical protein
MYSFYAFSAKHFKEVFQYLGVPGNSVSIMSGYGLDDRAIGVRLPVEARGFFL